MNEVKEVIIPQALAQAIYNYLYSRGMNEVENLVHGLRGARPYEEPADKDTSTET